MEHLCNKREYKKNKERIFVSDDVHEFEDECMNKKISNKSTIKSIIDKFSGFGLKLNENPKIRLSEVSKKFRDAHSHKYRLKKLFSIKDFESLEELKQQNDSIVKIIGNITLKKLTLKNNPESQKIRDTLFNLPAKSKTLHQLLEKQDPGLTEFDSIDKARDNYRMNNPGKNDFEAKAKIWEDEWNAEFIYNLEFKNIQTAMKKYKKQIIEYDLKHKEKNAKIIDSFLKLDNTITYKKYVDSIHKLPLSIKAALSRIDL